MATRKTTRPRAAPAAAAKATRAAKRAGPKSKARPKRKQPETLRLRAAAPSFTVDDVEKSLTFYRDVLGFVVQKRWESKGRLEGVEMLAGRVLFMIGQDDWKKGRDRVKGEGFRLYCQTTQDVDRLAEQIKARGGTLLHEPRDEPWGGRAFTVEDPDGFKMTISREH